MSKTRVFKRFLREERLTLNVGLGLGTSASAGDPLLHQQLELFHLSLQVLFAQVQPLQLDPGIGQQEVLENLSRLRPIRRFGVHHHADELFKREAIAGFVESRQIALPDVRPLWPISRQALAS